MSLLRRETDPTSVESRPIPARNEPTVNRPEFDARAEPRLDVPLPIQRLLFVSDAAVADVHECPLGCARFLRARLRSMC